MSEPGSRAFSPRTALMPAFAGASTASMAWLVILILAATTLEGVGLALVYPIIEVMRTGEQPAALAEKSTVFAKLVATFGFVGLPATLLSLMVATALLVIMRQVVIYASTTMKAKFSYASVEFISSRLFRLLTEAELEMVESERSGTLLNALTTESKRAAMLALAALNIIAGLIKLVLFGIVMLMISWQATLVGAVILTLVIVLLSHGAIRRSLTAGQGLSQANDRLSRYTSERLRLFRLIKLSRSEAFEGGLFQQENVRVRDTQVELARHSARLNSTIEPAGVIIALSALYLAAQVLGMGLSEIGIFILVLFRMMPVMQELATAKQQIASYRASLDYISDIAGRAQAQREVMTGQCAFPVPLRHGIRFDAVTYDYPVREASAVATSALGGIDLLIPAGQTTALLGPSGAGKSTMIDLLPRLKRPTAGRLWFDDVPADEIALPHLRRHIAMVSQEVLLVDGSVEENLRYGNPDATSEEVRAAARAAFADDFIQQLPQGYDTLLGERGARLSGGQRQRIALARALLARVPVLLLDEPTSALDAESEQAVQRALERLQREHGTTIVIIAHRLSTVSHADYIVVLENGRVVGAGTHQSLLASGGWYRKIVALQTAGEGLALPDTNDPTETATP